MNTHLSGFYRNFLILAFLSTHFACGSSSPKPRAHEHTETREQNVPRGPTRTDFKKIADTLVRECIKGGWISAWRSTHEDVDVARPKVYVRTFTDETDEGLDSNYLVQQLEGKMKKSGVFEIVSDASTCDFDAVGTLRKMAERSSSGRRFSVYTATLELTNSRTENKAHQCEAVVRSDE